ncbi:MAG: hypothetical protein JWM11_7717 [Planctomycetaceae bacterium]|nr:hypothetical protein [Planctomycetaceae bacterium]
MRRYLSLTVFGLLILIAGCFPIELDVSEGRVVIARAEGFFTFQVANGKLTKVIGNELGEPVYARFSPDGKELLAIVKAKDGFQKFEFYTVPVAGGKPRKVFQGEKTAYVRYSPDGTQLAVSLVPSREDPVLKTEVPEVQLVNVKDGKTKSLAQKVGVLTRWFPDSKRLLVFQIVSKVKDDRFAGNIAAIDISSGKITPICSAVADKSFYFDLSPDGKTVIIAGHAAGKVGTDLSQKEAFDKKLFQISVATGEVKETNKKAEFAIFSPDGKRLAIGTEPEGFTLDRVNVEICELGKLDESLLVAESYKGLALGGGGGMFPGWIDNESLYYFDQKAVYGTEAKSVSLFVVKTDGKKRKNVQPVIDLAANAEEQ